MSTSSETTSRKKTADMNENTNKNALVVSNASPADSSVDRIDRFQSLEAGTYWRATKEHKIPRKHWHDSFDTIEVGEVLLLLDIEMYEGKPHTIVLRGHPLDSVETHRFLINDFLNDFELALDAEEVRGREMAALQKEIVDLQNELMDAQVNPQLLGPVVESELKVWQQEADKEDAKEDAASGTPSSSTTRAVIPQGAKIRTDIGFAIQNKLGTAEVRAMRRYAEREAKIAEVKAKWIKSKTDKIASKLSALTPFFEEKTAVALARTNNMRRYAKEIMAGIQSLDLYTGKGVDVVEITTDGEGADPTEPLTLLQRKLFVNEELAVWADVREQFDFLNMDQFDKALRTSKTFVNQLIPFPRGVVSMAVRRDSVDYKDVWTSIQRNIGNKLVFLLVRDGDKLYRVYSDLPSHEGAERLFPTNDELDQVFRGVDGESITYNDIQFTQRADIADQIALSYKRTLILLCGLDHRLNLFGDFYDQSQAFNFISKGFQEAHMRFIADDETNMLIGESKPHVLDWIKQKNKYLQSGSRVLCVHDYLLSEEAAPSISKFSANPLTDTEVLIAYKDGHEFCVEVKARKRYGNGGERDEFNARASLTAATFNNRYVSFLCLDAIKAEELEWYINNRESRIRQIEFIRLFKITAAELRDEEKYEAPAREYLKKCVTEAQIAEEAVAEQMIDHSIRAWRCANRGAPLPSLANKEAFHTILNHVYSLKNMGSTSLELIEAHIKEKNYAPLKAVLTGKNRLAVYVEVPESERDDRIFDWRWVKRISLSQLKSKLTETSEKFVWLTNRTNATETEIKVWPAYEHWVNKVVEPFRPAAMSKSTDTVEVTLTHVKTIFSGKGAGIPDAEFKQLLAALRTRLYGKGRTVSRVTMSMPFASYVDKYDAHTRVMYLSLVEDAHSWLSYYSNDEQRKELRKVFVGVYANKEHATEKFESPFLPYVCATFTHSEHLTMDDMNPYRPSHLGDAYRAQRGKEKNPSYADEIKQVDVDRLIADWMSIVNTKNDDKYHSRPEKSYMSSAIWDGERATLRNYLDLPAPQPMKEEPVPDEKPGISTDGEIENLE